MGNLIPGVVISIRPEWWAKIQSRKKRYEMRKNMPKKFPDFINSFGIMRCYCYISGTGKVAGYFDCVGIHICWEASEFAEGACISVEALEAYRSKKGGSFYAWGIRTEKTFDEPIPLAAFGMQRPPQSWCYYGCEKINGKQICRLCAHYPGENKQCRKGCTRLNLSFSPVENHNSCEFGGNDV